MGEYAPLGPLERMRAQIGATEVVARYEATVQAMEDALRFYASRENWLPRETTPGIFEAGPAVDGGGRARDALRWS